MPLVAAVPEAAAVESEPECFYRPGPSIQKFHDSRAFVRIIIGGRGSGKTAACSIESIRHGWHCAGAKILFVRKTEASQVDSTIDTLRQCFDNLDPELYRETEDSLFRVWNDGRTIRIPSAEAVRRYHVVKPLLKKKSQRQAWLDTEGTRWCSFIEMRGLPNTGVSQSKLRGFECSMMVLIEADQIAHEDFMLCLACLRWKGADPKTCDANGFIRAANVVLDTNPPSPSHWIAQLEENEKKKPENERQMAFWHISTYENEQNLPPNYIERQILLPYAKNPAMIERMLWGRYADAFSGQPVYYAFERGIHVAKNLRWPIGAFLVRGYDFGTCNAVTWSAYWMDKGCEYWHILFENVLEGSDTERQAQATLDLTSKNFPFWNDRSICAGVLDFCDPSGGNSNFSTKETGSSVKILNTYGIHPGTNLWQRSIAIGVAIINRLLTKRDPLGNPCFRIDEDNCPLLVRAFSGGYKYPSKGDDGYGKDEPMKGISKGQDYDYSHVSDSCRYPILNAMRLLRQEYEAPKKALLPRVQNPNPAKRF